MTDLSAPAARALMGEWQLALTAERKSPNTIALYLDAVGRYLTWTETQDLPPMRRTTLQTWITDMLAAGRSPSTARIRQQAVRRYAAWLTAVGHLDAAPFQGMISPKLDQPVVDPLTVAQVRALLQTCEPLVADDPARARSLRHVRNEAIIRLMAETGIRLSEVIALAAGHLDLDAGLVTIERGKGGRGRVIPVGPATAAAIRSYLAVREQQRHAAREELWLGERGSGLATNALYRSLRRRADRAGIAGFRPHRLRHTAAHRWLAAGGCSSATPAPEPVNGRPTKRGGSTSGRYEAIELLRTYELPPTVVDVWNGGQRLMASAFVHARRRPSGESLGLGEELPTAGV